MSSVLSESKPVRLTLGLLGTILGVVVSGVLAWASANADIATNTRDIMANTQDIATQERRIDQLETKHTETRELLLEIRGDIKALRAERRSDR